MKIRVITMTLGNNQDGFSNQDELDEALACPGVVSVERQFFQQGDSARMAFVVTYGDEIRAGNGAPYQRGSGEARYPQRDGKKKKLYPTDAEIEAAIPEDRRKLYSALRDNRNETARLQRKKGWMLANNYQLAHIVCRAPQSADALSKISELGASYCKFCGEFALQLVKGLPPVPLKAPEGAWWSESACYREDEGGESVSDGSSPDDTAPEGDGESQAADAPGDGEAEEGA